MLAFYVAKSLERKGTREITGLFSDLEFCTDFEFPNFVSFLSSRISPSSCLFLSLLALWTRETTVLEHLG